MTVSELIQYFGDGDMFPNPKQEVKFTLCPDGAKPSVKLDILSTTVPEKGEVVVKLEPAPKKKFVFSLKFEANPEIEAETLAEAEVKAIEMMRGLVVGRWEVDKKVFAEDDNFVAQEPYFLEEAKE